MIWIVTVLGLIGWALAGFYALAYRGSQIKEGVWRRLALDAVRMNSKILRSYRLSVAEKPAYNAEGWRDQPRAEA